MDRIALLKSATVIRLCQGYGVINTPPLQDREQIAQGVFLSVQLENR